MDPRGSVTLLLKEFGRWRSSIRLVLGCPLKMGNRTIAKPSHDRFQPN
jgi:hypothetical protein